MQTQGAALRDRNVSPLAYAGVTVGPRLGVQSGGNVRVRSHVYAGIGALGPASMGRRVFEWTVEDPLTGEASTYRFRAPRTHLRFTADFAVERAWDASSAGVELSWRGDYASGVALGTYAFSDVQLGPSGSIAKDLGGWTLDLGGSVAVLGVVTRFPWSTDPIQPGMGLTRSFFASGTRVSGPWDHLGLRGSARLRQEGGGWTGWLTLDIGHDWHTAPLSWATAGVALGWSK